MKVEMESIDDLLKEYDLESSKGKTKDLIHILDKAIKEKPHAPEVPSLEESLSDIDLDI